MNVSRAMAGAGRRFVGVDPIVCPSAYPEVKRRPQMIGVHELDALGGGISPLSVMQAIAVCGVNCEPRPRCGESRDCYHGAASPDDLEPGRLRPKREW